MRKFVTFLCCTLVTVLSLYSPVYAASVPPQTLPGNDSNPMDYEPPEGCIHYEIPNSGQEGTFTVNFDETGAVDPTGAFSFTVVVGTGAGEDFTKVLSWSSNFPIYAVIVKGGNAFNLYQYDTSVRGDTNLVSPDNASGQPADVSHVSIVICPEDFPPEPPTPTPSPSPTSTPTPTPTSTPTPCPPCPTCPPSSFCFVGFIVIFIILLIAFFLLGLLCCKIINPCCNKQIDYNKNSNQINQYYEKKDSDKKKDDCKDNSTNNPCGHDNHKNGPPTYPKNDYYN